MKMDEIYKLFKVSEAVFRCPICHYEMQVKEPASIICKNKHCYDISKDGYINFLPNQKQTMYHKQLFESRRCVFENGYYIPLADEIINIIDEFDYHKKLYLFDAGCGEGYYDCYINERLKDVEIFAFDNSKEAVRMGAKSNHIIKWFVGNISNIPIKTEKADVLLEIFAPSNYSEFKRIVKKGGHIIKAIPGDEYLKELRQCIGQDEDRDKERDTYRSSLVLEHFSQNMEHISQKHVMYKKPVDQVMAARFLEMSPLMFGKEACNIDISKLEELTFEFIVLYSRQ